MWLDATLQKHWKGGLCYIEEGVEYRAESSIENSIDGWIDYMATYSIKAKSDSEAKKKALAFLENYGGNVEIFSLYGINEIMTEEDL